MKIEDRIDYIVNWIKDYIKSTNKDSTSLVIGVSGGIDSSVTSTLCAKTGLKTLVISLPIRQNKQQHSLSLRHAEWLQNNFKNVVSYVIHLDDIFNSFKETLSEFNSDLAFANSRSRLRMTTLYQIAQYNNGIVVGTGNKVEDFGIGFYTKYGDGGVDISPIADCTKTQVWEIGKKLCIIKDIIEAKPTDGLWDDNRSDEEQIGLTYKEIEAVMNNQDDTNNENYKKFLEIRKPNLHKIKPIPVCKFKDK